MATSQELELRLLRIKKEVFDAEAARFAEYAADIQGQIDRLAGTATDKPKAETSTSGVGPYVPDRSRLSPFDSLPWKKNQYGEWVFANIPEARELVAKIGTAKSWTDVDGWEYSLSGEGKKFLNRKRGNAR